MFGYRFLLLLPPDGRCLFNSRLFIVYHAYLRVYGPGFISTKNENISTLKKQNLMKFNFSIKQIALAKDVFFST